MHAQDLMDCCIWLAMPGHQKHSCNKDRVWSHPWWPASLWHPFKVVTWWALGTMKSRKILSLTFGHWVQVQGSLDELWNSANSVRSAGLLHWRHVLPEVPSNLSSSVPSASPTLCSTLGPLSGHFSPISNVHLYKGMAHSDVYLLLKCSSHPQLWWGHELWPSMQFPMSLHQGLISLCPGPVK